jgi:hypothetical protein
VSDGNDFVNEVTEHIHMSSFDIDREQWSTRLGFLFAAVGSAVGLGNIWRFPFITEENSGQAGRPGTNPLKRIPRERT